MTDGEPWVVYQGGIGEPARIRLVRADGTGDHALLGDVPDLDADAGLFHPDWSHDGKRLAFGDSEQGLWIANVDGGEVRRVFECVSPCGYSDHPSWSPDDSRIAFVTADYVDGGPNSTSHLEILDVTTSETERILEATDFAWFYVPRWAPDGHRLVMEATRFATARFDEEESVASTIGIVDLDDADPEFTPVLPWSSWATYPDWHPTDDRIVFQLPTDVAQPSDEADVAVVDIGDGEPVVLTDFGQKGGWAIQPTWARDGEGIWFVAEDLVRTHPNAAWINADGTGLERMIDEYFRTHPRQQPGSDSL